MFYFFTVEVCFTLMHHLFYSCHRKLCHMLSSSDIYAWLQCFSFHAWVQHNFCDSTFSCFNSLLFVLYLTVVLSQYLCCSNALSGYLWYWQVKEEAFVSCNFEFLPLWRASDFMLHKATMILVLHTKSVRQSPQGVTLRETMPPF